MDRKQFLALMGGTAAAALVAPALSQAQGQSAFRTLTTPVPTDVEKGKIQVTEFFWFSCPHCNSLEPVITDWASKLPGDVVFVREHVPSRESKHQFIYYALQSIGQDKPNVMRAVFDAYHKGHKRLNDLSEIAGVVEAAGVDRKKFEDAFNSFGVRAKVQRANKLAESYGIEGVPAIGINGKYLTSPEQAGGNVEALKVADELIARERKAGA